MTLRAEPEQESPPWPKPKPRLVKLEVMGAMMWRCAARYRPFGLGPKTISGLGGTPAIAYQYWLLMRGAHVRRGWLR